MSLSSLTTVKAIMGVSGTSQDVRLQAIIDGAEATIARITGLRFGAGPVIEDHEGGVASIALRVFPVNSISTVVDLAGAQTISSEGYELETSTGLLKRLPFGLVWDGSLSLGPFLDPLGRSPGAKRPRWRVTMNAGFAAMPADLLLAIADMTTFSVANQGGKSSEKDGDYAVSWASQSSIPPQASSIIQSYMRVL